MGDCIIFLQTAPSHSPTAATVHQQIISKGAAPYIYFGFLFPTHGTEQVIMIVAGEFVMVVIKCSESSTVKQVCSGHFGKSDSQKQAPQKQYDSFMVKKKI